MNTYLLAMHYPAGPPPADVDMAAVMSELEKINADIRAAGGWVFAGGLEDISAATTVRPGADGAAPTLTDGPYLEAKEHLGGITVVRADDYDVVLDWAGRYAKATGLAMEVRPFARAH